MRTHNMKKIAVPAVLVGFGLSICLLYTSDAADE